MGSAPVGWFTAKIAGLSLGMLQKIYEVDPLICPKCKGEMRIIAFIEDYKVVKKILDWLGIYEFERKRPPPKVAEETHGFDEYIIDDYIDCNHVC